MTGTCELVEVPLYIDIAKDAPSHCELTMIPIEDGYGGTMMTEALVCNLEPEPYAPEQHHVMAGNDAAVTPTEEVVVCNSMDGQCHNVLVEVGHVPLEGTEQQTVPVSTENGDETM